MKAKDYANIEKLLMKKRALLLQTERGIDKEIKQEAENRHGDDMDLAEADHEQEVSFFFKSRTQGEIKLIDEALSRIEKKGYGNCADCGEDIPKKRLEVQPYTIYCVECQEALETADSVTGN